MIGNAFSQNKGAQDAIIGEVRRLELDQVKAILYRVKEGSIQGLRS